MIISELRSKNWKQQKEINFLKEENAKAKKAMVTYEKKIEKANDFEIELIQKSIESTPKDLSFRTNEEKYYNNYGEEKSSLILKSKGKQN